MTAGPLDLNDRIFGKPREVLCVLLALAFHAPLLLWRGRPDDGPAIDPIEIVEFKVEEDAPAPPPPVEVKPEQKNFFDEVRRMVGLARTKPADVTKLLQTPPPPDLAGTAPAPKINVARAAPTVLGQQKLTERAAASPTAKIALGDLKSEARLADGGGTLKDRPTANQIGRKDLPLAVGRGTAEDDGPRLAVSNLTDKSVKKISTDFFGAGGGTGGGEGKGDGGGGTLRDKGGGSSGLSGTSGGFAGINDADAGASGNTALVGNVSGAKSGAGGYGNRSPYEISGPLSGRKILSLVLPDYPDWAREQGLSASVTLRFFVRHTGTVNGGKTTVNRTSGYKKLDDAAIEAIKRWRFAPLPEAQYGQEQWGFITFKFRAL